MTISAFTDSVYSQDSIQETKDGSALGQDDFLTLLVAQLQNQDPLNPMDGTEFTAQLATFNSLEQLISVNEKLTGIQEGQTSLNNFQAAGYIGKSVKAHGNSAVLDDENPADLHFMLNAEAATVMVSVYDPLGEYVRTIEAGGMEAGDQTLQWDGENDAGDRMPGGIYTYEVQAADADQQSVTVTPYIQGRLTGVAYENGAAVLMAGDIEIPFGQIIEITE